MKGAIRYICLAGLTALSYACAPGTEQRVQQEAREEGEQNFQAVSLRYERNNERCIELHSKDKKLKYLFVKRDDGLLDIFKSDARDGNKRYSVRTATFVGGARFTGKEKRLEGDSAKSIDERWKECCVSK